MDLVQLPVASFSENLVGTELLYLVGFMNHGHRVTTEPIQWLLVVVLVDYIVYSIITVSGQEWLTEVQWTEHDKHVHDYNLHVIRHMFIMFWSRIIYCLTNQCYWCLKNV